MDDTPFLCVGIVFSSVADIASYSRELCYSDDRIKKVLKETGKLTHSKMSDWTLRWHPISVFLNMFAAYSIPLCPIDIPLHAVTAHECQGTAPLSSV
ncbi:MAG: hypothetical protein JRJ17_07315 [Deltaproteobacteria bacterium]|nr:hypothetical protein [Deltaproteobacteria bacterium]